MFKKITILAALFIAIFAFNACDPTVTPTVEKPEGIELLQATSINATTVGLRITGSPSETNALFEGYYLKITPGTFPEEKITNKNLHEVTGLVEGTVYTFTVYAKYTNGEVSPETSVQWSPATRYNTDIRIYEFASARGSGITLQGEGGIPQVLKVTSGDKWDLCLDTRENVYSIGSPKASNYTDDAGKFLTSNLIARDMDVYNIFENISNLSDVFDTKAINAYADPKQKMFTFTTLTTGFVMAIKTIPVNGTAYFAKVFVKAENGKILQGTAPDRYVQLEISYQKVASVPYAVFKNGNQPSHIEKFNKNSNK